MNDRRFAQSVIAAVACCALPLAVSAESECAYTPPEGEFAALHAIYFATNGAQWIDESGWFNEDEVVCGDGFGYAGVTCDCAGHVRELRLPRNNLDGVLPAELGQLAFLEHLDLGGNALGGPIPSSLLNLEGLASLDITYNKLFLGDSPDSFLVSFLNELQPDWADTQTVAPTGVTVAPADPGFVLLGWTPIDYTGGSGGGGYEVFRSTISGGPYGEDATPAQAPVATVPSKTGSSAAVPLDAAGNGYFAVRAFTNESTDNPTKLTSGYSAEASSHCPAPLQTVQASGFAALLLGAAGSDAPGAGAGAWNLCYDPTPGKECYVAFGADGLETDLAFTAGSVGGALVLEALVGGPFCGGLHSTSEFRIELYEGDNPLAPGTTNCARETLRNNQTTEGCLINMGGTIALAVRTFQPGEDPPFVVVDSPLAIVPPDTGPGDDCEYFKIANVKMSFDDPNAPRQRVDVFLPAAEGCTVAFTLQDETVAVLSSTGVNQPPIPDPKGPYTGEPGVELTLDGSDSVDPDGSIVTYSWGFGDGTSTSGDAAAAEMPMHTYSAEGIYTVTLTVMDDAFATRTATTTVEIAAATGNPGDIDGDGDVDIDDVRAIVSRRAPTADGCPACDMDGDGRITVGDARQAALLCDLPRCVSP